jgi:hypothetical protein
MKGGGCGALRQVAVAGKARSLFGNSHYVNKWAMV